MSKILISGYTGFIGTNLTGKLTGQEIYGVDIIQNKSVKAHFQWDSFQNFSEPDCIIHLAGKAHDIKNTSSEIDYFNVNVGLTQKIFQFFLNSPAKKFIFFSSVKAVADSVPDAELTEQFSANPTTAYGRSKLEAENYILNELEKWQTNEKSQGKDYEWKKIYILRPCMIHGPGNKGNMNLLFKLQKSGLPWPLGAFENKRSFCSIDNLLFVIQSLIDRDVEPGIYQIADDEPLSTNELIRLIALFQNKRIKIWNLPVTLIRISARIGDLFHLPLNSDRLMKLTESYIVSNRKIKNALGIDRMPVTVTDGINRTLFSFREQRG
jgi:nucleoside-diphosphate-sugar epimerase